MAGRKNEHAQGNKAHEWQVTFFIFSYLSYSVSGQLQYSIFEEIRIGSSIGNLGNDLGLNNKDLSIRKFRIVSRVSEKYFKVNLENGKLLVKDRIDRESLCKALPECYLTFDAVIENPLNVFQVKVDIKDINDNPPRFSNEKIELEVSESTLPGAQFVLQNAQDSDVGINSLQNYKLSENQYFVLGEKTSSDGSTFPELVLNNVLDREVQSSHELILTAFDGGNPVQTGTTIIKVIVTDFNDNFPVFTQDVYKVKINENTPINYTVLYVSASDKDEGINAEITYSFSTIPNNIFTINPSNGEIKTKGNLDFEEAGDFEISVQAKDGGGLVSHSKVLIEIIDENDNAPEISITSLSTPISEDSMPGTVIALIEVHDLDSGENGQVDCVITGITPFKLLLSIGHFYKIVTTSFLDREKISYYNITVQATDKGFPQLSYRKTFRLDVSDINDNTPVFEKSFYTAYIPENNLPGASIYSIHALDIDAEENAKVTYFIVNSNKEEHSVSSYISINPETGVLYAQRSFDYEQHNELQIQVMAKDSGLPSLNSSATVKIVILDQNDNPPKILYPSPEAEAFLEIVPFSSEEGSLVTKVVATDADSGHNAWLSYNFLQNSEQSHFNIDQHTGLIRTSRKFQERDHLRQRVVVIVKDNGNPILSASVTIHFIVADNFQQVIPQISSHSREFDKQSNTQIYLVVALVFISILFMLAVMYVIISTCRKAKSTNVFSSISTNSYPQVDPRTLSKFNNGSLPFSYSYDVCVTLDSSERDFAFLKPHKDAPVDCLIDADDSGIGHENVQEILQTSNNMQVSHCLMSSMPPYLKSSINEITKTFVV